MNDFLVHIGWLTLSMSLVILLVMLFNKTIGKKFSAKSRYTVWTVVVLSLCIGIGLFKIPSLFTLEFSMPSFIEDTADVSEQTPTRNEIQSPVSNTPSTVIPSNPAVPGTDNFAPNENTAPNLVPSAPSTTPASPTVTQTPEKEPLHIDVALLIFVIWAIGAVLYFSFGMAVYLITIRKYNRKIKLCDKQTEGMFHALCRKYGVKRIPGIFYCPEVGSPILYGYTEPTVLLPDIKLSANSLVGVLAHELTHYRRGDIWIKLACLLAESLYWFNPIVHLATARCNAEMELSCDEEVLAGMDEDTRRSYGNVMLEIVEHCSRKRSLLTTQFNPHKNAVRERIMNILDMTKKKRGRVIITVALILCIVAGTVIGCTVKDNNNKIKESVYTIEAGVTSVDSLAFENVDTDVITELVVGKDVESIDFAYINTFPALTKVTMEAENEKYASKGNYIVSKDGDELYLCGTNEFDPEIFNYANEICNLSERDSGMTVIFGDAVMYVDYAHGTEFDPYSCYLEKLEAYGQTLEYRSAFGGGRAPSIYTAQDYILLTDYGRRTGNTYIISEHGIWEYHTDENASTTAENYNEPIFTYTLSDDGVCSFVCQPRKYLFTASMGDILPYSVGRDEFYSAEGIVTVTNGKPVITLTASLKVLSDRYTDEELSAELEATNKDNEIDGKPTYATLDELFSANASKYERFEFDAELLSSDQANSISDDLTQFLNKTFTEIEAEGYTLEHLQGNNGWAGWPNYSISGYDGVTLTFRVSYDEATREHLTNIIPDGVEITNPGITINGLRVSMTGEEAKQAVTSWDDVFFSFENGGRNYVTTYNNNNGYKITAYWAMPEEMYNDLLANLPDDGGDEAYVDAKKKLVEPFKDNPVGEIVGLRIEKKNLPTSNLQ